MANHVNGTEGADNLLGTRASDHISGLGGNDHIHALAGDDWLFPGAGSDVFFGDEGSDRFVFRPHDSQPNVSQDTVRDFHQTEGPDRDIIYLQGFHPTDGHRLHWIHHGHGNMSDPFTGHPGQVRCAYGHLQVDLNGDKVPDFDVMVWADNRRPAALTSADVLLFLGHLVRAPDPHSFREPRRLLRAARGFSAEFVPRLISGSSAPYGPAIAEKKKVGHGENRQ